MTDLTLAQWISQVGTTTLTSGGVLLVVMLLDLALAKRVSARARIVLYAAVFVRLALPTNWASPIGLVDRFVAEPAAMSVAATTSAALSSGAPSVAAAPVAAPPPLGFMLHAAIAAMLALVWLVVHRRQQRALSRGASPAGPRLSEIAGALPVLEHASSGPAVFGLLRPRIAMPSALLARLDDEALRAVLAHEAAHLRRRDPLLLAFVRFVTFVAWPIAPAWIAAWRVRGLIEQACDEVALAKADASQRRAYGETLLAVASWSPRPAGFAVGMLSFGGGLAPRLRALRHASRWPRAIGWMLAVGACALVVLGSGQHVLRAEVGAAPEAFPPLLVMDVRVYTDTSSEAPPAVRSIAKPEGDRPGIAVGPTSAMLASLGESEPGRLRGWLGGAMVNNIKLNVAGSAPAQLTYRWSPRMSGDEFSVQIEPLGKGISGAFMVSLAEGESIAIVRATEPFAIVMLTPTNVSWSGGVPTVSSPRVSLDLRDATVESALKQLQHLGGVPVKASASPSLPAQRIVDEPLENAIAWIAREAKLVPHMTNGMLELAAPMNDVEARLRAVGPPELRILDVREKGDQVVVHARLPASAMPAFARSLEAEFKVGELAMSKPEGDPGSTREGDVELLLELAPLAPPAVAEPRAGGVQSLSDVEARLRVLAPEAISVQALMTEARQVVVHGRLRAGAETDFIEKVGAEWSALEVNVTKSSDAIDVYIQLDVTALVPATVDSSADVYLLSAAELSALASRAGVALTGPGACASLSASRLDALRSDAKASGAKLVAAPRISARLDERASVSTSGPDATVELGLLVVQTQGGLVLQMTASSGEGVQTFACSGLPPVALVAAAPEGRVLLCLVEARLEAPR